MRSFVLIMNLFISLYFCGCSELFSTVGNVNEGNECADILKEHPDRLTLHFSLLCLFNADCKANLHFGWIVYSDSTHGCYKDYEYKFTSKSESKKIHWNDNVYDVLETDEHIRFSLFDQNHVEKSYDIDLSKIIHSYTFKEDSVEIKMPENGTAKISIECPYCSTHRIYDSLCQGIFACNYQSAEQNSVIVGTDSSWGKSYGLDLYLGAQSSMKTDSIKIIAEITFR